MRLLLLVSSALALAACLLLAVAFLGRPAKPPSAGPGLERDAAPAAAEQVLALPGDGEDSRSAQAVELPAASESTGTAPHAGASIAGLVRVNGSPPMEPITLVLAAQEPRADERRLTIGTDGRFEFLGLPAGFRGGLRIPRRYRFLVPESRTRVLPVEAPEEGLGIDLERLPCLTGRLVALKDGEPVDGAHLKASITWRDGNLMGTEAELEGNRFFVSFAAGREIGSVTLDAWAGPDLRGLFEFTGDEIPPSLNLGQLALAAGFTARLVVLDPERQPVPGARVRARGVGGAEVETDADGRAALGGLPVEATLDVLARGFDPAEVPAPTSAEPMEIVLVRANRLTVRVLAPSGEPLPGARVRIGAEERLFVNSSATLDPFLAPLPITSGETIGPERGCFAVFITDTRGRVDLQSFQPSQALAVHVQDEVGFTAHEEIIPPMRAQEERELTIRLSREPRSLEGRVMDSFGLPLEQAKVTLQGGDGHGLERTTGADGRFQFDALHAAVVDLRVELHGYVTARLRRVPMPRDGDPLQIVLDPGRDVEVRVIDPRGKRIDAGSISASLPGEDRRWGTWSMPDGSRHLVDVPVRELEVRLQLAGKEFRETLAAHADEIAIEVPELGRLEVVPAPDPGLADQRLGLLLRTVDGGVEQWARVIPTRTDPTVFEAVLPGSYELSFSTWEQQGFGAKFVSLRPPMRVRVAPGETTRVHLR